jgi:hypothetical protein
MSAIARLKQKMQQKGFANEQMPQEAPIMVKPI